MKGYTVEMAAENEAHHLIDALCDGCIELNDEFLSRYAGEPIRTILGRLDTDKDRAYALSYAVDDDNAYWIGGIAEQTDNGIWLNCSEIEVQFEGDPEEFFDDPDDWAINGDLAYCSPGYGLMVEVDLDALRIAVNDMID